MNQCTNEPMNQLTHHVPHTFSRIHPKSGGIRDIKINVQIDPGRGGICITALFGVFY